jgi:hypothetical protein
MPFGFGSNKREKEPLFNTHLIDTDDSDEINKITEMLNPDERVLLVARQSPNYEPITQYNPAVEQQSEIVTTTTTETMTTDPQTAAHLREASASEETMTTTTTRQSQSLQPQQSAPGDIAE